MSAEDQVYYRQRADQERRRAAKCSRPDVRHAHEALAELYEARLRDLEPERPILRVVA